MSCIDIGMILSITVGILSILVMLLMGWNIYTVIDVKSKLKEYEVQVAEIQTKISKTETKRADDNSELLSDIFFATGLGYLTTNLVRSIAYLCGSIIHALDIADKGRAVIAINELLDIKHKITSEVQEESSIEYEINIIQKHQNYNLISGIFKIFLKEIKYKTTK